MSENQIRLNPQIMDVDIGVRNLRNVTIYPLSMADELKVTNIFMKGLQSFFKDRNVDEIPIDEFVSYLLTFIQDNLTEILGFVTDPEEVGDPKSLLKDITNSQFFNIANIIYKVNFEDVAKEKNAKSLLEKIQNLFQLRRQLPQSASGMDTDSNISTSEVSEKEE